MPYEERIAELAAKLKDCACAAGIGVLTANASSKTIHTILFKPLYRLPMTRLRTIRRTRISGLPILIL